MKNILLILLLTSFTALGQVGTPTYNPFNNGGFQNGYQRPNNRFQNNGFQNGYQRPNNGFQNNGFQNNGFQNNGFQNNGFQNNGFQNNGFQQQNRPTQTNTPPLFTRRFHLNNGYLFGRQTLYFDPKSGRNQPWVRKNLR